VEFSIPARYFHARHNRKLTSLGNGLHEGGNSREESNEGEKLLVHVDVFCENTIEIVH